MKDLPKITKERESLLPIGLIFLISRKGPNCCYPIPRIFSHTNRRLPQKKQIVNNISGQFRDNDVAIVNYFN